MALNWTAGAARRPITPNHKVELAGCGYYLGRTWQTVQDAPAATAVVIADREGGSAAIAALDLMYNEARFTRRIREIAAAETGLRPEAICVNCSHSHSAPTAGWIRGAGEPDADYLEYAAAQAAAAVAAAFRAQQPARLLVGAVPFEGWTFNRTRENGPVDTRLGVLYAENEEGRPIAAIVNFHAHPVLFTDERWTALSRDVPGEVVDRIEAALPGAVCMYLQGACGNVEFLREYRRDGQQEPPIRALTAAVLDTVRGARPVEARGVSACSRAVSLPVRRWTREEVQEFAGEGEYRQRTGDTAGWLDGIARNMVNQPARLPWRYGGSVERAVAAVARFAVDWAAETLPLLDSAPLHLDTEVQALRFGDVYVSANAAELFSGFSLELRARWPFKDLFVLGYSNGSIGYLPDAYDIERGGYAALQSPKGMRQFPFTARSGEVMVEALAGALREASQGRSAA